MHRMRSGAALVGSASAILLLGSCAGTPPSVLDTVGGDAARIERLWWVMLGAAGAVFAFVVLVLIRALRRSGSDATDSAGSESTTSRRLVVYGGVVMPIVVLTTVFTLATIDLRALAADRTADLDITVTGRQWWWEVDYPSAGVTTANEIHVPVGETVRFHLESADVIHSFWVPQAGPKRDTVPGHPNDLTLSFDRPGTYRGMCAEFCGLEHAKMQLLVVAEPRSDFDRWLVDQAAPAIEPTDAAASRGRQLFVSGSCTGCHDIRGVSDAATDGPDLTHLASRSTIAGASLDLDHATLTSWISDPGYLKPGVLMPPSGLTPNELNDLVAYLESLR